MSDSYISPCREVLLGSWLKYVYKDNVHTSIFTVQAEERHEKRVYGISPLLLLLTYIFDKGQHTF